MSPPDLQKRRSLSTLVRPFLPFVPVLLWLFLFSFGVNLIPDKSRPPINVTLLPQIDSFFFHNSHTWFTNDGSSPFQDLLAAFPYTVHPLLPLAYLLTSLHPPRRHALPAFIMTFGILNLLAVLTHLSFPTAPPWYFLTYGTQPASYSLIGSPAILSRVDDRLGIRMFHNMYEKGGKVVFGAWPSLHAAWPYLIARFHPPYSRRVHPFVCAYAVLVWWAAIYLQHHYAFDIIGGIIYTEFSIFLVRLSSFSRVERKESILPFVHTSR